MNDRKDYDVQRIKFDGWPYLESQSFIFCHVLTDGKICRKGAVWGGPYFGDNELYCESSPRLAIGWVLVEACEEHASILWPGETS